MRRVVLGPNDLFSASLSIVTSHNIDDKIAHVAK